MAFVVKSSASPTSGFHAPTGRPSQGHVQYAVDQGAYWVFWLSSTQSLNALYSLNSGVSWSTPTGSPFTLAQAHDGNGQDLAAFYGNIAGDDILHVIKGYETGTQETTDARFTLGSTWTNANVESQVFAASGLTIFGPSGATGCFDSNSKPVVFSNYTAGDQPTAVHGSTVDSGTLWVSGWTGATQLFAATSAQSSGAPFSLGSGNALWIGGNASGNASYTNLLWSAYNGSSWPTTANVFGSSVTSTNDNAWGAALRTASDVHVVSLANDSNTYVHARFNGSSWSAGDSIGNLTFGSSSGVSLVSDGTSVYAVVIDSSNNVQTNKWTSGSGWAGWTVLEARTNTPSFPTGIYNPTAGQIMWIWSEINGSNYDLIGSTLTAGGAPPAPQYGLLVPTTPVKRGRKKISWRPASGGPPIQYSPFRPIVQAAVRSTVQYRGNGRVMQAKALPPALTPGTVLRGLQPTGQHPGCAGQAKVARALPPASTPGTIIQGLHVASPRRPVPGSASTPKALPGPPPAPQPPPHQWTVTSGLTGRRNGRVWQPKGLAPPPVVQPPPLRSLMVASRHRWQPGKATVAKYPAAPPPPPFTLRPGLLVCRRESELRRIRGRVQWLPPAPLFGPAPPLGYHIYSNAGSGPINYSTPIATVYTTTWTSGPLAFPDTWMFGVRAFNGDGEELNLDASVTIILDANGNDITNRPKPPFATRAFARAGGAIRVEWSYNTINPSPVPTGFHVYLGVLGVLCPVSPLGGNQISSAGSAYWTGGALASPGLMVSQAGRRDRGGRVQWRNATGGGVNYTTPVATVSFQSAIAGSFVANIPGLINGVAYQVGVRAYNAVAEEPNTSTVTVTADSVGPGPVVSLTAVATA